MPVMPRKIGSGLTVGPYTITVMNIDREQDRVHIEVSKGGTIVQDTKLGFRERFEVGENVFVTPVGIRPRQCSLAIDAPPTMEVNRVDESRAADEMGRRMDDAEELWDGIGEDRGRGR